ncbi:hypothetical protein PQO03_09630 [Lentisphaera profundi]|uniref:DUF115 domain-containing protein n=1 Tax=Lentisphaera profundi TaxID=1658616 RepID=A0ABY7VP98_9BACT|nr:hypothetical protein [Lentisphaera profundi]WDE95973.1 hypothetical protein PQO03_09630 [Lentisphaera profundi]
MEKELLLGSSFSLDSSKKCFIIGSGPSIKDQNLKLIRGHQLIFLNNMFVHEDLISLCDYNDVYLLAAPLHPPQSREEWRSWLKEMNQKVPSSVKLIFGLSDYKDNVKSIIEENNLFKNHAIRYYLPYYYFSANKISFDFDKFVSLASTASVYAIMFSIYSSVKEVYLLGIDHSYILYENTSEMRYYSSAKHQKNEEERCQETADFSACRHFFKSTAEIITQYELLGVNDVQIYSISKSTLLKSFPIVDLETMSLV